MIKYSNINIEQRNYIRKHPELKELFITVCALQDTIEAIPSLQKSFQGYLDQNRVDFQRVFDLPDSEI